MEVCQQCIKQVLEGCPTGARTALETYSMRTGGGYKTGTGCVLEAYSKGIGMCTRRVSEGHRKGIGRVLHGYWQGARRVLEGH